MTGEKGPVIGAAGRARLRINVGVAEAGWCSAVNDESVIGDWVTLMASRCVRSIFVVGAPALGGSGRVRWHMSARAPPRLPGKTLRAAARGAANPRKR